MASDGREFIQGILPQNWMQISGAEDGASFAMMDKLSRIILTVIISQKIEGDYKRWLHVSVAHQKRLPTWEELRMVKDLFIGKDKKAFQILPSEDNYVNIHPYCLHLFCCLDDDGLPEFSGFRTDVGNGKARTL